MLLDQSGSIKQSDPTGARLCSTKAFLAGMGANDAALLAALIGGNPPLYDSLDSLRRQVVGDSALAVGKSKPVVVFSDGADTRCASPEACRSRRASSIANARQDQIRIFTIGLSNGVDVVAMAELAHQSGGAFL